MSHKIYGQQVLFIEEDNPIVASTPEEMVALLTSDNVGKFVKYIGETRDFEFSTPTGRNIPVTQLLWITVLRNGILIPPLFQILLNLPGQIFQVLKQNQ